MTRGIPWATRCSTWWSTCPPPIPAPSRPFCPPIIHPCPRPCFYNVSAPNFRPRRSEGVSPWRRYTNTTQSESAWVGTGLVWQGNSTTGGYSGFFSIPAWQQGFLPSGESQRGVPDVALNAAGYKYTPLHPWPVESPKAGTSAATPERAGMLALDDQYRAQKGQAPVGLAAPLLYPLAGSHSSLPDPFHAITQGSMNGFGAAAHGIP